MRKKKEEKPVASFIWCGAVVQVYTQTITFAGTVIQRHLLPKNLRQAVDKAAQAECLAVDSPRHVQQNQRRVRNEEQQHYGLSARASQRRSRSGG